jgi:hypothetical protein
LPVSESFAKSMLEMSALNGLSLLPPLGF